MYIISAMIHCSLTFTLFFFSFASLNDVCLDDCQWSAKLLPEFGQNLRSKVSGSQWLAGSQISNFIGTSRKQLRMQQIYLEDLEELHHAILHLRDEPVDMNS